jgi:uncharacterized small protein (DUF1192 family)
LPPETDRSETFTQAVTEVTERVTVLVREEIELAKAEVMTKVSSIVRGAAAVAAGAVFGVFALVFGLSTLAWGLADVIGHIWIGFIIVFGTLMFLALGAFLFAFRKLRVGAPTPKMAIDEAKLIRETVTTRAGEGSLTATTGDGA